MAKRKPVDDTCYICGTTFTEVLANGTSDNWTFQWNGPFGLEVVAETCSDACSDTFDEKHRNAKRMARV